MNKEDCYFFVDMSLPEEERAISVMCTQCHDEKYPDLGWFYRGSVDGYGPFEYQCVYCNKVIHDEKGEHVTD